jgi:glycosyltransferase involved in cell wall biosynthesis
MKIAILTPTFSFYSGIDRVVELQAKGYSKKGFDVTVIALEAAMKPGNFKLQIIGMPKNLLLQRVYRLLFFLDRAKIKKAAEKLKDFDLIISHFYPMNLIASYARKKYGVKYIYHNHGIGFAEAFSGPFEKLYMKIFIRLNNYSLKNADSANSVSKFLKYELKKESGLNSSVVYNEIDERYKEGLDGSKVRKLLGVKKNEFLLFFIGRLSPHKNVHTLLKIFDIVHGKKQNTKLLIIGRPTFRSYYENLKKNANKNVIIKEYVDDGKLPHYYAASDLYVTASLWEGFNLPAAEAQACGKKVVAFNVCSHPEVVKKGALVQKDNIEGFADAIIKFLK